MSYTDLREQLARWNPDAGPTGFEGLVAQALSRLTSYTFRLARSGSQFGRDAATPQAPFAIAVEAKRYNSSVPLQELVGKAGLAGFALKKRIDLWVLAATVEIGENAESALTEVLEQHGIAKLTLDWAEAGVPRLAVLIAATQDEVLPWVEAVHGRDRRERLEAALGPITQDPRFEAARAALVADLQPATVGLDAFRAANERWIERRLSNKEAAQDTFSQYVVPMEAAGRTVPRPRVHAAIERAVSSARSNDSIVAVLGREGSGKTWAATKWWADQARRPILLLSVGRIEELLIPGDEALDMVARLATLQDGRTDQDSVARWRRRLENWSTWTGDRVRFCVLVDGLNETSGKAWATILRRLAPAVRDLGGVVVATCREGYWDREVGQRIGSASIETVTVDGYDDDEFRALLDRQRIDPASLPPRLDAFMRNPRVCALALQLLPQLTDATDLTMERLLLEYWRARVTERGDLVGHDPRDFDKLLIAHARAYRERPGRPFDRDDWLDYSGAAKRADGRDLRNDLSDIEEGRFFDQEAGRYTFRPESLRFALGLLVADEVRDAATANPATAPEAAQRIVDAVRGFDIVAEIVGAAVGIACLDEAYPDRGIAALLTCWSSLQNLSDDLVEALLPYVAARPGAFLDAYEGQDAGRGDERLLHLLLDATDRPSVRTAISGRLTGWLGSWSRGGPSWGETEERARRAAKKAAEIDANLVQLTPGERRMFEALCRERPQGANLSEAAALFLIGSAQAPYAEGVVAHCLAAAVAPDRYSSSNALDWAVRLNRVDPPVLAERVREIIAPLASATSSKVAQKAAAHALRLLGTLEDQERAQHLRPVDDPRLIRRGDRDPDVDPLDPESSHSGDFDDVVARLRTTPPGAMWNHMSSTSEDHDLERSTLRLARFAPQELSGVLNGIVATADRRDGMPLRQLSWRLPWLSPLFSDEGRRAVRAALNALSADPSRAPGSDADWMTSKFVEGLMPHLAAEDQLDLLIALPDQVPSSLNLVYHARPLNSDSADRALKAAIANASSRQAERTLLFLERNPPDPTGDLRTSIAECLNDGTDIVAGLAVELVIGLNDPDLDEKLIAVEPPSDADRSWKAQVVRRATAAVIARRARTDLIDAVPAEHLDWVAARLPAADDRLTDAIERSLDRLAAPISAKEPAAAVIELGIDDEAAEPRLSVEDQGEPGRDPAAALAAFNEEMSDTTGAKFKRRQDLLHAQVDEFLDGLAKEGALAVARRPQMVGLDRIAAAQPERFRGWLDRILTVDDASPLRALQNLGFPLARAFAAQDPELSARVFRRLLPLRPYVNFVVGRAKLDHRHLMLFGAARSPALDQVRAEVMRRALDDSEIERLVAAAEQAGATEWLDRFVAEGARSSLPADQALAITIASFRPTNPQSDEVLGRAWGTNFLGWSAQIASERYLRGARARHWLDLAARADDPAEFWRHSELAVGACDRGSMPSITADLRRNVDLFGGDLMQRLTRAMEKASTEVEKTLYGVNKPSGLLAELLREAR